MAYMDDQALERERTRQKLLEGKTPLLGDNTQAAIQAIIKSPDALSQLQQLLGTQGRAPKGVGQTPTAPLQVAPGDGRRRGGGEATQYNDGSPELGGMLKGLLDKANVARGHNITKSDEKTGGGRSDSVRGQNYGTPKLGEPGAPAVADAIPGLKPGFDASKLPPGSPAAVAYMHEKAPGPAVTGVEKGVVTGGYQSDVQYLAERGGHNSKMVDGKIVNSPLTEKGAYRDLDPELAARLRKIGEDYEAQTGQKARFGEFSRGEDVQRVYRDRYERGGGLAARPGQSRHQHGGAGDVPPGPFRDWADKNRKQYGVDFPHPNDKVHVQIDPAYKGPSHQRPAGPAVPPMDKSVPPPTTKPDTAWPDPSKATPADKLQAEPPAGVGKQSSAGTSDATDFSARRKTPAVEAPTEVASTSPTSLVPQELLPGGKPSGQPAAGGSAALVEQRKHIADYYDKNPDAKDSLAAAMYTEDNNDPIGRTAVAESRANDNVARARPVTSVGDANYFEAMHKPELRHKYDAALQKVKTDPQFRAQLHGEIDNAFKGGTNHAKLGTDFGSAGVAAAAKTNQTHVGKVGGNDFFIKDRNPNDHGAKNVADIQKWKASTEAALKNPQTPQAPADTKVASSDPKDVGSPSAAMRDAAQGYYAAKGEAGGGAGTIATPAEPAAAPAAPPSAFDSAAPAVPYAGVGGMYGPEYEASTTGATEPGPGTEALNAIKPPAVPQPPAVAAPAPAAPPPVAAVPPPAPPPAPAAARTAAPAATAAAAPVAPRPAPPPPMAPTAPPPGNPAHRYLDMKTVDFAESLQKGAGSQVPGMVKDMTVREVVSHPIYGGMAKGQLQKGLDAVGVTPRQFQDAIKEGPPKVGKRSDYGTSGATEFSSRNRTSMAPPGLDGATLDPASQPAVQNADGSISTVRTIGMEDGGREVNMPSVPQEGGRIMSNDEAFQRYKETGNHLGKYDSVEEAGRAAETLHQNEAREISQHPQGQQPTITPEMAQAIQDAMKDQSRPPMDMPAIPPEAQPVLPPEPIQMPGAAPGGAPGGLSLAPAGLQQGGVGGSAAFMPGASQGGSIAMAGMLPPIQNSTFSTPLLDSMASSPGGGSSAFNAGSFMPISLDMMGGLGWGGGSGFGSGSMGGGFDFGGGGGFDMGGGLGGGGFSMPMSFGGGG